MVDIKNIPAELKTSCRFCVWKFEKRNGQKTKMPYNPANGDSLHVSCVINNSKVTDHHAILPTMQGAKCNKEKLSETSLLRREPMKQSSVEKNLKKRNLS